MKSLPDRNKDRQQHNYSTLLESVIHDLPAHQAQAVDRCGSPLPPALIQTEDGADVAVGMRFRCRHRLCPHCARKKAQRIYQCVKSAIDGKAFQMVTLTCRDLNGLSADALSRSIDRIRKLRSRATSMLRYRAKKQNKSFDYIWALEVTTGEDGTHWHPHLHVLVRDMQDASRLVAEWLQASRELGIYASPKGQKISRSREKGRTSAEAAASYVTHYVSKRDMSNAWSKETAINYLAAMQHVRRYDAGGEWRPLGVSRRDSQTKLIGWQALRFHSWATTTPTILLEPDALVDPTSVHAIAHSMRMEEARDRLMTLSLPSSALTKTRTKLRELASRRSDGWNTSFRPKVIMNLCLEYSDLEY